jgi:S1-C subfamily serine protease
MKTVSIWTTGALLLLAPSPADRAAADEPSGKDIYHRLLRATTVVITRKGDAVGQGTGWLVDRANKLIVTNQHVVGDSRSVQIIFPAYRDGKLVAERSYYRDNAPRVRGKVVVRDVRRDLAVIEVESLPDDARELTVAADAPEPSDRVHSVGNPGASDALWVYTSGTVRQVYRKKWKSREGSVTVDREARVVETQSPINPGDSGGPVVNDKGEVIGVTSAVRQDARLVSICIDASEIKPVLAAAMKTTTGSFAVKDDAKFFSAETIQTVNDRIRDIARKYRVDVLIETVPAVPADKIEEVKRMSSDERAKFFGGWVKERLQDLPFDGIYILVCREPNHLRVAKRSSRLSNEVRDKVSEILLDEFRKKRFDEGIVAAVEYVRDQLANADK